MSVKSLGVNTGDTLKQQRSSQVDAFTLSWREGKGFFHPPVHKIVDVVRYAKEQEAEGILVVPDWPGSAFWAFLKAEERIEMKMKFWPFLVAPKYFKSRTFSGRPKFDFAVFHMKFGSGKHWRKN